MTQFPPGTFSPSPQRASVASILKVQGAIESRLMLRHGEQLLLSLIIPVALLLAGSRLPLKSAMGDIQQLYPMILAVAVTSAGFTGQAIALAFDRRYGALKRTGASGVPSWAIIAGKVLGVLTMVLVQVLVLSATAFAVGFRTDVQGVLLGGLTLIAGVATFTSLGLILGGTLSSEIVLAVANLFWFALLGVAGWTLYAQGLGDNGLLNIVPTVALAAGLSEAFTGSLPVLPLLSLAAWAVASSVLAAKWFRFEG
ncbi:multidrug ABC transporter permease [Corynebacterium phocae]|uniref:Multidrug ABC transporter permease n=1 Tax=Corynebacterium phocae TaxID=161895 RepID=A0A1L7D324_9CORY|nr:ABC transporter permease [Corynebacterium phocae]APT92495.1 multidrug ABC transporter permease [Corynebacterium phocae]KAA8725098.1 multidrug ABC transporter permease [Corynebacterium phocae]